MMDDYDIFTDEKSFVKPDYKEILNKYVNDLPAIPSGANYQSGKKLLAEEFFVDNDDISCAFHFSEAVSASLRTMTVYRDEQMKAAGDRFYKIRSFVKPANEIAANHQPISKDAEKLLEMLTDNEDIMANMKLDDINEDMPLYKKYMRFGPDNNVENFQKILKELPKEWTIIQLTAPYNPNENLKPLNEYRTEIDSIYITMFTNDYLESCDMGPVTVHVPANVTKEGERPLFLELYSLLDDNYKTIDNAQYLNSKRLVHNYWSKREDIDLRMKSVINVMNKEWLGGWGSLLTGKLRDTQLRDKIKTFVDTTISDWGFIKLTPKQKVLLYNLIGCSPVLASQQIKSCIRRILTEYGNTDEIRQVFQEDCSDCSKGFRFINELCLKCLSKCFQRIHNFSLVDGIKAFSQAATEVIENDEWAPLKKARRNPVILIVDEMLDTFPWESLPVINHHPVSRVENIHFLYNLFKIHEKEIVNGYFSAKAEVGRYIINPEKNLDRMEKRMCSFVGYWCGSWRGVSGEPPPPADFLQYLAEADIFLYCGHGDGCQYARGAAGGGVESVRGARAVSVLSGCGSSRVTRPAPRAAPSASHHHMHIAGCPVVIGMLWEVTDLEVDRMVSALVALYVPSAAPRPWPSVGKGKWSQGQLDIPTEQKSSFSPERDLLVAVSRARESTNFVMIASSMVARGLPARITHEGHT